MFELVMDRLTNEIREEPPLTIMFAYNTVICCRSQEDVETELERYRYALERRE